MLNGKYICIECKNIFALNVKDVYVECKNIYIECKNIY